MVGNRIKEDRIRALYLHNFIWYYSDRIDILELSARIMKLDTLFNRDSIFYGKEVPYGREELKILAERNEAVLEMV